MPMNIVGRQRRWSKEKQRDLFYQIKQENSLQWDDFYHIPQSKLVPIKGIKAILRQHNDSLHETLQALFPEHNWDIKNRKVVTKGYWNDPKHHREYIEKIARELNINTLDDWYNVTYAKFDEASKAISATKKQIITTNNTENKEEESGDKKIT